MGDLVGAVSSYLGGLALIMRFYVLHVRTILALPHWLRDPDVLAEALDAQWPPVSPTATKSGAAKASGEVPPSVLVLSAPTALRGPYDRDLDTLRADLRGRHGAQELGPGRVGGVFLVRLATLAAAWYGHGALAFALSLLQFLPCPYSLPVSLAMALALAPPIFLPHYVAQGALQAAGATLAPLLGNTTSAALVPAALTMTLSGRAVAALMVLDQLACGYCQYFVVPSLPVPPRKMLGHVVWGFVNCKTYSLVILLFLWRAQSPIYLLPWILDAAFGLTRRLSSM
jgi:hypothetical protein